jgi:hypothetical protein
MAVVKHYELSAFAQSLTLAVSTVLKRHKGLGALCFRCPSGVANATQACESENQDGEASYPQILWISLLTKNLHHQFL